MKLKNVMAILLVICGESLFAQYAKNSAALTNMGLVSNPNPESSIEFKSYGSDNKIPWVGDNGITETVSDIMEREKNNPTTFNGVT